MLATKLKGSFAKNLLLWDTFTDSNTTPIASHTPDINTASGTYRSVVTFGGSTSTEIVSNTVRAGTSVGRTSVSIIETNESDIILTCDVNKNSTGVNNGGTGVAFRWSGSTGYVVDLLSNDLRLAKNNGTSATEIVRTSFIFSNTTTYTIKIVLEGNNIEVFVDGTSYINTTDSTYTGTEHGISVLGDGSGRSWADNLEIIKN